MKITEFNCETGEEITRDATAEEITRAQVDAALIKAETEAVEQTKIQRQALLTKLGITEEEAKLLLGGN